jgi:hypothetical protein
VFSLVPDRCINLSDEEKAAASSVFQDLNNAYELIGPACSGGEHRPWADDYLNTVRERYQLCDAQFIAAISPECQAVQSLGFALEKYDDAAYELSAAGDEVVGRLQRSWPLWLWDKVRVSA